MSVSEARRRANDKWDKENTERVQLKMPKGYGEIIRAQAEKHNLSKTKYIKKLIDDDVKKGESND